MARSNITIRDLEGLWQVRGGKTLLWPISVLSSQVTSLNKRGGTGYVVDMDAPWEAFLCWGMVSKFEPVPETDEAQAAARERIADPHTFPRPVQNELSKRGLIEKKPMKRPARRGAMESRAKAQPQPVTSDAPALDTTPKGRTTRRRRGGSEDAAEGTTVTDSE